MQYQFIESEQELADYCRQASLKSFIAVDTEFVRTRTLYPRLGLVQLYDGEQLALVDPVAISDLTPLKNLLTNESIITVLHACSEDLETFWSAMGIVPTRVFDTQVAAAMLNMGSSLGYAKLVEEMSGVILDKGESRTDWLARPLSQQQLHYAANDVLYLFNLYPQLAEQIEQQQKTAWVFAEVLQVIAKKQAVLPLECAYLTVKNNWQLKGRALLVLKRLASWRLQTARERDIALNFVLKEQAMLELARRQPGSKNALHGITDLMPQDIRRHGDSLINVISQALSLPPEHYPAHVERLVDFPAYKKTSKALRDLCVKVAQQNGLPVEMLGSKKQINQLLKWLWFELDESKLMGLKPDLISGWRAPLLKDGIDRILPAN
ncbi:ribonuclease D [Lacimicrobium alkaliphilum]|uniref:Ribonuclease D n=1 Tax=Lacimicrobium alkaliphilum TaxID=1526571 RepID=A0ABQ1RCE4_9ALTE|nr:ribonuclease D [Lacimicrobium alkaliphilum]GGD63809.1 ribonuclease D [Lacimicrobium alkaliphilum]